MFAIVRTGGKQYRVAAGDKIAVEKIEGEAGDTVSLGDILLAYDGGEVKDAKGLTVSAEIIAQTRGEKVIVFKKRRRRQLPPPQRAPPVADAAAHPVGRRSQEGRAEEGSRAEGRSRSGCRSCCARRRKEGCCAEEGGRPQGRNRRRKEARCQEGGPQEGRLSALARSSAPERNKELGHGT